MPTGLLATLLRGGYRIEVYSTFAMLSELGYIVRTRRPPAPTSDLTTDAASFSAGSLPRPAKRQRLLDTRKTASVAGPAGGKSSCSEPAAGASHPPLGPQSVHLDVFAPDKSFRRSAPGTPNYVVSVCSAACSPPNPTQVRQLAAAEQGSTLLHAVASGADVQLLSLSVRSTDEFDLRNFR